MPVWVGSSQRGLVVFKFSLVRQGRQGRRVRRAVRVRRVCEGREESKPGMGWAGSARRKTHVVCPLRAPFLAFLVHRVVAFVHPIPTLPEPPIQRNAALTNQLPLALLPTIPTHTGRASGQLHRASFSRIAQTRRASRAAPPSFCLNPSLAATMPNHTGGACVVVGSSTNKLAQRSSARACPRTPCSSALTRLACVG